MKKLETLSAEQKAYIPILRKKWEDLFYLNEGIDKENCEKYIRWLYKNYLNRDEVSIMYMKSPLGCQILIGILKQLKKGGVNIGNNLRNNLEDNLRANLWNNLLDNLGNNILANLWDNLRNNLRNNLSANLRNNLSANLGNNLSANLRNNLSANLGNKIENSTWFISIGAYGFAAFYDFIQQTGYFDTFNFKDFNNYKRLLETGIHELYVFDNVCVVCEMPKVHQDQNKQLHNVNGPAAEWRDGWKQYFVNGRSVEPELVEKPFSKDDLINESNEDKKAAMITIIKERDGNEGLLKFLGAYVVDEKVIEHRTPWRAPFQIPQWLIKNYFFRGYKETVRLYKTEEKYSFLQDRHGKMNQPYCWSEIVCPSTGTTYLIDNSADFTCAEEALKFLRPSFVPKELLYRWEAFAN